MSVRDNFTADEWKGLLRAPMLAGYAVAGAAPSRQDDFVREMAALADGIAEGERRASKDSLLGAVVADIIANAGDEHRGPTEKLSIEDVRGRALGACRAAAGVLKAKADPKEAYDYKRWAEDDPAAVRRTRRGRPGADRDGQDGRLRPAHP